MALSPRVEELKRRVQQDPASIAFAALAEEYRRAGRLQDAIEVCRAGLQRHPAYLSARVTLGRALLEIGEIDEGREHLEQVLKIAPENLAAIRALAEIHRRADFGGADAPTDLHLAAQPAAPDPPGSNPLSQAPIRLAVSKPPVEAVPAIEPVVPDPSEETLARLGAFLGAIGRARETLLAGGHASPR
jgi:tetratricopeptide (TPR) repeat protein